MPHNEIDEAKDILRHEAGSSLATTVLTREVDGAGLSLKVSPCSWMYPGYGLQVGITMDGEGGTAHIFDKKTRFHDATREDLNRMLNSARSCLAAAANPHSIHRLWRQTARGNAMRASGAT